MKNTFLPSRIPTEQELYIISSLGTIEALLWAILLVMIGLITYLHLLDSKSKKPLREKEDWSKQTEDYVNAGKYSEAIQLLKVSNTQQPNNPLIHWWLGKLYFYKSEWSKSVFHFEKSLLLDPSYKHATVDFLAFIELNNLVAGLKGYIK